MKIKHKTLSKDICLLDKKAETIEYKLSSYICPLCKKEIICLSIEGRIVYGGEGSYGKKEGCIHCVVKETFKEQETK